MTLNRCNSIDERTGERCLQIIHSQRRYCIDHQTAKKSRAWSWITLFLAIPGLLVALNFIFPQQSKDIVNLVGVDTCDWDGFYCTPEVSRGRIISSKPKVYSVKNGQRALSCSSDRTFKSCFSVQMGSQSRIIELPVPSELKHRMDNSIPEVAEDWELINPFVSLNDNFPLKLSGDADRLLIKGNLKDFHDGQYIFDFNYDQHKATHDAVTSDYDKDMKLFEVVDPYGNLIFSIQELQMGKIKIKGYFIVDDFVYVATDNHLAKFTCNDDMSCAEDEIIKNKVVLDHDHGRKDYI